MPLLLPFTCIWYRNKVQCCCSEEHVCSLPMKSIRIPQWHFKPLWGSASLQSDSKRDFIKVWNTNAISNQQTPCPTLNKCPALPCKVTSRLPDMAIARIYARVNFGATNYSRASHMLAATTQRDVFPAKKQLIRWLMATAELFTRCSRGAGS